MKSNLIVPKTQGIKYAGSKLKMGVIQMSTPSVRAVEWLGVYQSK